MLIKNLYSRIGSNVIKSILSVISSIIIVRVFGVKVIGQIAYYYGIVGMMTLFSDLGVGTAFRKFLTDPGNHKEDVSAYIIIKTALLIISCVIVIISFFLFRPEKTLDPLLIRLVFIITIIDLFSHFFSDTLAGKRAFVFFSKIEVIGACALFSYNLLICFCFPTIYLLALNIGIMPIILIFAGTYYSFRNNIFPLKRPTKKVFYKYIRYAYPISFSSVIGIFATHFEKVIIGKMVGMTELGFYRLALGLFSGFDIIIKPVTNVLFTELSFRLNRVKDFIHTQYKEIVMVMNFTGSFICLIILFFSVPVAALLYGVENTRVGGILMLYALVVLSRLFWRPYRHLLYAIEAHHPIAYLSVIDLGLRIALYILLIPLTINKHLVGAIAIPLTETVLWIFPIGIYNIKALKKRFGTIHLGEIILKIWVPLLILIIISYLVSFKLILFPVAIILFMIMEYLFKIVTEERWNKMLLSFKS